MIPEHKIFIIEAYFRNGQRLDNGNWEYSAQACLNEFRERFPNLVILATDFFCQVRRTVAAFRETGSVADRTRTGRPHVRTAEQIADVQNRMQNEPSTSIRRLAQEVNLSYGTCRTILKKDLNMHPYRLQMYQELLPPDYNKRILYCNWFLEHLNNDALDLTFFSDESWFYLNGYVNSQVMRLWSADNPHFFREASLHCAKIGVWVALSRRRIIGPIFFEGTINAERYQNNILEEFVNQLHDDEIRQGYFQQDNARPHVTRTTLEYLQQFFDDRLISKDLWPPRSCDLTLLDFFFISTSKKFSI